jgi:hypothetical protein
MKRRKRKHESTYHEAGHAVAAFVLALKIGKRGVSIVPDREKGPCWARPCPCPSPRTARLCRERTHSLTLGKTGNHVLCRRCSRAQV